MVDAANSINEALANRAVEYAMRKFDEQRKKIEAMPPIGYGECDCGAATEGKWADKHTAGCPALVEQT